MGHRLFGLGLLVLALTVTAQADDAPLHSAGQLHTTLVQADVKPGGKVTVKVPELARAKTGPYVRRLPRVQVKDKDESYDLAKDVQVRWHDLPKGTDGKARQFTPDEYQKLREPLG